MRDIEHRTQCACVRWFRLQYPQFATLLFAIPNGGARNAVTGARLKAEGVVAGAADLFLAVPGGGYHGLFIEMKTENGTQSTAQKEFQAEVTRAGYRYEVVRSFDGFIETINSYNPINQTVIR